MKPIPEPSKNKLRNTIEKLILQLGLESPTFAGLWRAAEVDSSRWNKLVAFDGNKAKPTKKDIDQFIEGLLAKGYRLSTAQEKALYQAIDMNVTLTEKEGGTSLVTPDPDFEDGEDEGQSPGRLSLGAAVTNLNSGSGQQFNIREVKAGHNLYQGNTYNQTTYYHNNYYNQPDSNSTSNPTTTTSQEQAQVRLYLRLLEQTFEKFEDFNKLLSLPMRGGKLGKAGDWPKAERERLRRNLTPKYAAHLPANNAATTTTIEQLSPDKNQPEVAVEEFLQEHTRITLLGALGAGKSTTLRRLVRIFGYYWTGKTYPDKVELKAEWQGFIPLFGFLNQWQDPEMGLVEFVQEQIRQLKRPTPPLLEALAGRVPELMEAGRVVLLLDGLNELPGAGQGGDRMSDSRARAIAQLGEKAEWGEVACVLSCRVREFTGGPNWNWRDLHVLPLKREQVEEFAQAYFEGHPEVEVLVSRLVEELYESKDQRKEKLQKLAEQPFYLRKFLAYYEESGFPNNAAQLLDHSLKEALRHEVEDKIGLLNPKEEGEELAVRLSYLAFNMTEAEMVGVADEAQAAGWLFQLRDRRVIAGQEPEASPQEQQEAKELLRQGEGMGLLTEQNQQFQFSHQLWQEYFAARYIVSQDLDRNFLERANYRQFNEVWRLCGGLDETLVDRLIGLLPHSDDSLVRQYAASTLGWLGDSHAVEPLIVALRVDKDSLVRLSAARALGWLGDHRADEPLRVAFQDDEDDYVRSYAIEALGNLVRRW